MKTNKNNYIYGFDYLRVFLCIMVVFWHSGVGVSATVFNKYNFPNWYNLPSYIFVFNFLLLAVPGFLLLSNYLFISKGASFERLVNSIKKYLLYYLVSTLLMTVVRIAIGSINTNDYVFYKSVNNFYRFFTGATFGANYFFVSLIFTLIGSFLISKIKILNIKIWTVFVLVFLFALNLFAKISGTTWIIDFYNPISFIAIPFLAILLRDKIDKKNNLYLYSFITLFTIFIEYFFLSSKVFFSEGGLGLPIYARPSSFLIVFILIILFSKINVRSKLIESISKNTLIIFIIHPYFITAYQKYFSGYTQSLNTEAAKILLAIFVFIISGIISEQINKLISIYNK